MIRELAAKPPKNPVGAVVKTRFGDVIIVGERYMTKRASGKIEYKWAQVSDPSKTGWIKISMHIDFYQNYPFVRMATPKEMKEGVSGVRDLMQKKYERVSNNIRHSIDKNLRPGDIVNVHYSNGTKKEVILQIAPGGKVAIVRQDGGADFLTKRRLLPASICDKLVDGGGSFNPDNPIYEKNHIYIPDFYKKGGTVAPRRPKLSYRFF